MSTYTFNADVSALVADAHDRNSIMGGGIRAIITPIRDVPFFADLTAEPQYGYNIFGGCLTASLPCLLTDRQRANLDLAKVELFGSEGLVWSGFVWDKPKPGEPLVALGPNCGLAMGPVVNLVANATVNAQISAVLNSSGNTPTWLLPAGAAYRAWMKDGSYSITAPNVVDAEPIDGITSVLQYDTADFGWYPEWVGGTKCVVPHLITRSTTPDYVLALRDASQMLDGGSMEPLASDVRVIFNGGSSYVNVHDSDPTHTLNRLGRVKWATLEVSTTDSGAATTAGGAYLTAAGRDQIKGSTAAWAKWHAKKHTAKQARAYAKAHPGPSHAERAQFARDLARSRSVGKADFGTPLVGGSIPAGLVRDLNGAQVPYTQIRPGQMLRVFTRDGPRDATITETALVGERAATITISNAPNTVDRMLARVQSKVKK